MATGWRKQHTWFLIVGVVVIIIMIFLSWGRRGVNIEKAAEKLMDANTLHARTELVIHLPERTQGRDRLFTTLTTSVEGDVKRAEDRTPELAGNLYVEGRGRGNVLFADGQVRILRDRVLFNLDNLPVLLNPSGSLVKNWTKVEVPLLTTQNGQQVREMLSASLRNIQKEGNETIDGEKLTRYSVTLSEEQEQHVADTLRQGTSGNRAAHVITRLLDANRVESLNVWVDGGAKEIRRVQAHFVRPLANGEEFDFALLTLTFSDYGKEVTIDAPQNRLVVDPGVFARLFGTGQVEAVEVETEPADGVR